MIVLDENIPEDQRDLLRRWRIRTQQIGDDIGRKGMKDENEILPLLLALSRPTFFTRDLGFFRAALCHADYCLACLAVHAGAAAEFIRRALRHPDLNTRAKRLGKIVEIRPNCIRLIEKSATRKKRLDWR